MLHTGKDTIPVESRVWPSGAIGTVALVMWFRYNTESVFLTDIFCFLSSLGSQFLGSYTKGFILRQVLLLLMPFLCDAFSAVCQNAWFLALLS